MRQDLTWLQTWAERVGAEREGRALGRALGQSMWAAVDIRRSLLGNNL